MVPDKCPIKVSYYEDVTNYMDPEQVRFSHLGMQ